MKVIGKFCVITDTVIQKKYSHHQIASMAVKGGADMIQLRDKKMSTAELIETSIKVKNLCNNHNVTFIVNDRVDVALLSDADGVHLGKEDLSVSDARKLLGSNKIIGATAHSINEALNAEKAGVDYIGFGHIFHTNTKLKKDEPKGIKQLEKVLSRISTPVLAIGGINLENIEELLHTGVYGVAIISSILKSKNPESTTKKFHNLIFNFLYL